MKGWVPEGKGWGPEGVGGEPKCLKGWGPEGVGTRRGLRPTQKQGAGLGWGPKGGGPKGGGPKGGGPKGGGPKGGGPEISRFFSFSRPHVRSFCLSLWVSSRGFLVVFLKARTLKCARLEFSGCRVKPRRPQSTTA